MMNQLDRLSRRRTSFWVNPSARAASSRAVKGNRVSRDNKASRVSEGQQGQQGSREQGQPGGDGEWGEQQRGQQEGVRRQLGDLMKKLDENGMPMPESLGRAERSMRDAEEALRRGDPREASRSQRRALDNLQQGMGDMAEQMRQRGPGNGQDVAEIEEHERRNEDRDPLGRSDGNYGDRSIAAPKSAARTRPPEEPRDPGRTRRRAGEPERPKNELDYPRSAAQDVLGVDPVSSHRLTA